MTEREKMTRGENFNPNDEQLIKDRKYCKGLCYDFNNLRFEEVEEVEEVEEGKAILKKLIGETKENFFITAPFYCDYGYNISLGNNFYSNHNLVILDCAPVKIGDNVLIGPIWGIYTAAHPVNVKERIAGIEYAEEITIEDNVWIGGGVQILPGVTIGKNSVIGSGSVVVKSIPPDTVAVGNPCRPVKKINE
ncbi:MAG: sugar O-acetyltransferase [Clostridiales bacterium]|nr:sugar O-acetyltransferase [Clostridiales bacterium]